MKILITGTAGFIGYHLANRLTQDGHEVVGIDSINNYYDVSLKMGRLQAAGFDKHKVAYKERITSKTQPNLHFIQLKLEDQNSLNQLFREENFDAVINLAAQAGVRYSLKNPNAYVQSNILGFTNILEACRYHNIQHLVYASSSSVYGMNRKVPFSTTDPVNHPVSLYAASKKTNELLAHTYSHLFGLPTTGLRFFTVYGPWGRPDMAYFLFTEAILKGEPIKVFNHGKMSRDFTYIDDIVEGIARVLQQPPAPDPNWDPAAPAADRSSAPYRLYNIGNNAPVDLLSFIETLEDALGQTAEKDFLPMQPGDVEATYADASALIEATGHAPNTSLAKGIGAFVEWYMAYYGVQLRMKQSI
ncbi:NAD-dependent epimerase [Phaeodactylibacter xiamenensis]|uniref:NAD-dependent epimerase n=1 Tax=Phaeodactylibacter xiamenensis TaxID=1524460 RepID=UPI003CCC1EC1